jgi:hypothetical protein
MAEIYLAKGKKISSSMDERSFLAGLREIQAIDVLQLVQKS